MLMHAFIANIMASDNIVFPPVVTTFSSGMNIWRYLRRTHHYVSKKEKGKNKQTNRIFRWAELCWRKNIMGSNEISWLDSGMRRARPTPPLIEEEDGMHSELYIKAAGFLLMRTQTHTRALHINNESCTPPPTHRCLPAQANRSASRGHALNSAADHTDTRWSVCRIWQK